LLLGIAAIYVNAMLLSVWHTAAPPGFENPEAWAYAARKFFANAIALCIIGFLFFINVRPGWPYLRSHLTWLLTVAALLAFLLPRVGHFFAIDRCLDLSGKWDCQTEKCIGSADA